MAQAKLSRALQKSLRKRDDEMQSKREAVRRVLDLADRERNAPGGHGTATLFDLYQEFADAFALRAPEKRR